MDNNIKDKGEFQLTDALENMKRKGLKFSTGKVDEWLDCGNKDATVYTNKRVLEHNKSKDMIDSSVQIINSEIIPPCFIGANSKIENCTIGPYVSIGEETSIKDSEIKNTIIQTQYTYLMPS